VHDHTNIKFPNLERSLGSWNVSHFIKKLQCMYSKVRFSGTSLQEALVCFNTAWNKKKLWSTRFRPPEEIYWSSSFNRRYQHMDTKRSIILIYLLFQSAPRELWISHNCLLWTSQYKMNLKKLLTARKPTWFLDRKSDESDLISEDLSTLRRHFRRVRSMVYKNLFPYKVRCSP